MLFSKGTSALISLRTIDYPISTSGCPDRWKWKWILTEVSRLRSGRLSQNKTTTQQLRETVPRVLVMSINRTRWLDKLRPAGASSGGWTEGPMAPVETTDAATVDQRCSFKHWAGWRHNHSNSKLCVAMRKGQANLFRVTNCRL